MWLGQHLDVPRATIFHTRQSKPIREDSNSVSHSAADKTEETFVVVSSCSCMSCHRNYANIKAERKNGRKKPYGVNIQRLARTP